MYHKKLTVGANMVYFTEFLGQVAGEGAELEENSICVNKKEKE